MGLLIKLLNGDTTLKSLKYGKDQLGGADSNQPFIQTPIGEPEQSGFASSDSILRGGITAPIHAAIDVVRLTKYFTTPGGLGFIVKQNILSRAAVETEVGGFLNEGVYNPLSTLAQAGVGFLGTHFEKQGLIPGISRKTYEEAAVKNNIQDKNKITLDFPSGAVAYLSSIIKNPPPPSGLNSFAQSAYSPPNKYLITNISNKSDVGEFKNRLLDIWWNKQQSIYDGSIWKYDGGPGSLLGVGKTRILFAKDGDGNSVRTGINNLQYLNDDTRSRFLKGGSPRLPTTIDYRKLLGASNKFPIDLNDIEVTNKGELKNNYGPHIPGSITIGNDTRFTSSSLSSYIYISSLSLADDSRATLSHDPYQVGNNLKNKTKLEDIRYVSTINQKLDKFGRHQSSSLNFDETDGQIHSVAPITKKPLGNYSSEETLSTDPKEKGDEISVTGTSDNEKSKTLDTATGYLANLNKNGGTYIQGEDIITYHNPDRLGGRGISYDFRQTNRKKRGFIDDNQNPYDYISKKSDYSKDTLDKIYYNTAVSKRTSNTPATSNDLIPFKIDILSAIDLTSTKKLYFRAYIDNLSDNYDATWTKQSYMGRAEAFHKYTAFNRDISLGFTVAAESQENLDEMYIQLNTLVSSLAPTYTKYGYMAGNIHQITIGNYIQKQYGVISSMNLEIMNESPWGIEAGRQLPYYIKVSGIKFTPIHDIRPEYNVGQFINQA